VNKITIKRIPAFSACEIQGRIVRRKKTGALYRIYPTAGDMALLEPLPGQAVRARVGYKCFPAVRREFELVDGGDE
jgi:hypothetical protein